MKAKKIIDQYIVSIAPVLIICFLLTSCKKSETQKLEQPDFITTSLSATLTVEGGETFELSVPLDDAVEIYEWTVPAQLELIEGQGTNKIVVKAPIEGGVIPERAISVIAKRAGATSYPRTLYKEITILLPPPSLENYETKRYGTKTWMVENLNFAGEDGSLGMAYDDPAKTEIYGRLYTWHEAMTGISNCTADQNPYKWGASGIDDVGNPYLLDGSHTGSFNIQVQGACPEGWHIPNVYDWYDLIVAVKNEYNVPGVSLADVGKNMAGYIIGWERDNGFTAGLNLTTWGIIGPYFKGSSPQSEGGLWEGGTTFSYGGNANFPNANYPMFMSESANVGFNILPGGQTNSSGAFSNEGRYSYHWTAYLRTTANNYPLRMTIGYNNANFSNGAETPLNGYSVRCVANY